MSLPICWELQPPDHLDGLLLFVNVWEAQTGLPPV